MEIQEQKIFPLRHDFVFRFVFGKAGNERLLMKLIDAILHFEGDRCIKSLEILNPLNLQETADDKFSIVDVRATDHRGRRFTIEMQARREPFFIARMTYYTALLYTGQLKESQGYDQLNPVYGIGIIDDIIWPNHPSFELHFCFQEQELEKLGSSNPEADIASNIVDSGISVDTASSSMQIKRSKPKGKAESKGRSKICKISDAARQKRVLADLIELHFVELPKYVDRPGGLRTRLEKWLHVLRFSEYYVAGKPLPQELSEEEEIVMAIKEVLRANSDERTRAILEDREKTERYRITQLAAARLEGLEEGMAKGIAKGRIEMVKNMLAHGIDHQTIAKVANMTIEEIQNIAKSTSKKT